MMLNTADNKGMYRNVVGYLRVSDESQIEGESLETQRRTIEAFAKSKELHIVAFFVDEGKSAKNANRAGLQEMLRYVADPRHKIQHIVVYKMIRASRNLESYYTQIRMVLAAKGISMLSATEPIDDTPMGRFMEGMLILNGQLDNDMKASMTSDNMKALALQGWWQHGPRLGYDTYRIPNEAGKLRPTLKPNAVAKLVRAVLERFGEGDITQAELTRYAASLGLRNRSNGTLKDEAIGRLLRSSLYAGYVCDQFTEYQLVRGHHEAIIPEELYWHNQKLLGLKTKSGEVHTKQNKDFVLKQTLICENCGKPFTASSPRTGGGKSHSPRYHCARKSCRGIVKSVKAKAVHDAYYELLEHIEPTDGVLKLYQELLIRQAGRENERLNNTLHKIRDELGDIAATRLQAIEDRVKSRDEAEKQQLSDLVTELDQRKLDKLDEEQELQKKQSVQEAKIEYAVRHMHNIAKQWYDADYDVKLGFQSMVFPEGVTLDTRTMKFGTEKISPLYRYVANKKDLSEADKSHLVTPAGVEPAIFRMRT